MAGLSEEEFHRYQQGLIELKSANYQLEEEKRQLLNKMHQLEAALAKKDDIIVRSKKARDFEQLANENDGLRRKLLSQGEEFHQQQETLMKEYSSMVKETEQLQQQLQTYRADLAAQTPADGTEEEGEVQEPSDASVALRRELQELCRAKQQLEEARATSEKELRVLRSENDQLRGDAERWRASASDSERQLAGLKQSLATQEAIHARDLDALIAKHRKTAEELEESASIRLQQLREDHEAALNALRERMRAAEAEAQERMREVEAEADERLRAAKEEAEERMRTVEAEAEERLQVAKAEADERLQAAKAEAEQRMKAAEAEADERLCAAEAGADSLRTEAEDLRQRVEDGKNAVKVQERKAVAAQRDLKKQLITEARRAEELQRRLEEVMVDATSRQSLEELFRPPLSSRFGEDSGSVRSWSASNSGLGTEGSAQQGSAFGFTAEDVRLMIQRLTEAQQENALLKEKVAHLEEGNAAQVEELRSKAAIIERYVEQSRSNVVVTDAGVTGTTSASASANNGVVSEVERISAAVKARFGDLVKSPEAKENSRAVQKNLQRMLEETLTKNIHLEQNLLLLTAELERAKLEKS